MGSHVENNAVLNNNQEVEAALLQSLIDNHGASSDFPFALQSQNHVQNNNQEVDAEQLQFLIDSQEAGFDSPSALQSQNLDEEDVIDFADSLPIAPDEYGSPSLYGGHGSSREYRRKQMAHSDNTLSMGPSSMDSTTATRHEQISLTQSGFLRILKAQHAPIPHSFMEQEGVSAKGDQFLGGISSTASKHKAREGARQVANIDLPKKVGIEPVKERKIVQVMNAKPAVKSRSNGSAGNERWGRFIHLETTTSSHISSPPSVYLSNLVVGLFLFLIMLREALIVH